jgi:hypothetical protein
MKQRVCYIGAVLVMLAFTLHLTRLLRPSAGGVEFSILGTPSPRPGGRLAFTITNGSDLDILYAALEPQAKSNGLWPGESVPPPGVGPPQTLPAGQAGTLWVGAPTGTGTWRVPVLWVYAPTLMQRLDFHEKTLLAKMFPRYAPSFRLVQIHTNFSPEVSPWRSPTNSLQPKAAPPRS